MASGSSGVVMHFGALALKAGACPLPNILVDTWPNIPGGDQPLSSPNTRVGESVQSIKYLATKLEGEGGTSGRGTPVDVSHRSVAPQVGTGTCDSVREGAALSGGGSVS